MNKHRCGQSMTFQGNDLINKWWIVFISMFIPVCLSICLPIYLSNLSEASTSCGNGKITGDALVRHGEDHEDSFGQNTMESGDESFQKCCVH